MSQSLWLNSKSVYYVCWQCNTASVCLMFNKFNDVIIEDILNKDWLENVKQKEKRENSALQLRTVMNQPSSVRAFKNWKSK